MDFKLKEIKKKTRSASCGGPIYKTFRLCRQFFFIIKTTRQKVWTTFDIVLQT